MVLKIPQIIFLIVLFLAEEFQPHGNPPSDGQTIATLHTRPSHSHSADSPRKTVPKPTRYESEASSLRDVSKIERGENRDFLADDDSASCVHSDIDEVMIANSSSMQHSQASTQSTKQVRSRKLLISEF